MTYQLPSKVLRPIRDEMVAAADVLDQMGQ